MVKKKDWHRPPPTYDKRQIRRQSLTRLGVHLFSWMGLAVLFYIGFSFFFDTPLELRMKHKSELLKSQYEALNSRYDSLDVAMESLVDRDRRVFKILFESEPVDYAYTGNEERLAEFESMVNRNPLAMAEEVERRVVVLQRYTDSVFMANIEMQGQLLQMGDKLNKIPAIQPVINPELRLLTASFGMKIQPFYKTLAFHRGVDYTIPEGSRVFATADGRVKNILAHTSTSGVTVIITHENGFETQYSHLQQAKVQRGQRVKRGEIIALSGNTGLSLTPHLHYEVRHNGESIDPVNMFFMELSPSEYDKIRRIANTSMQSFD